MGRETEKEGPKTSNGLIFACIVCVWLYYVERRSLGCEVCPWSQLRPLPQPSQVTATRSLQTLFQGVHAFLFKEQNTAPVQSGSTHCSSRPLAKTRLCNHLCNNRELEVFLFSVFLFLSPDRCCRYWFWGWYGCRKTTTTITTTKLTLLPCSAEHKSNMKSGGTVQRKMHTIPYSVPVVTEQCLIKQLLWCLFEHMAT